MVPSSKPTRLSPHISFLFLLSNFLFSLTYWDQVSSKKYIYKACYCTWPFCWIFFLFVFPTVLFLSVNSTFDHTFSILFLNIPFRFILMDNKMSQSFGISPAISTFWLSLCSVPSTQKSPQSQFSYCHLSFHILLCGPAREQRPSVFQLCHLHNTRP